jgi:arsenate reductase
MAQKGIDISTQSSKYLNQILNIEDYSVIVSLCPEAEIAFPPPPSKTVAISWNVQDPSKVTGSEEEIHAAYETVYQYLDNQIRDLVGAIIGNQKFK